MKNAFVLTVIFLSPLLVLCKTSFSAFDPNIPAFSSRTGGIDFNQCVENPVHSFKNLITDPEESFIFLKQGPKGEKGPSFTKGEFIHYQGIQKVMVGSKEYLVLSDSVNKGTGVYAGMEIVEFFSKHVIGCEKSSEPNGQVKSYLSLDKTNSFDGNLDHMSGIQSFGNYIIVAVEDSNQKTSYPGGFMIADLRSPFSPKWLSKMVNREKGTASEKSRAGDASIVKLSDGRFLAMVFGRHSFEGELFITKNNSFCEKNDCWLSKWQGETPFYSKTKARYQNVQFITGCAKTGNRGELYAIGTDRVNDLDQADLWKVRLDSKTWKPSFELVSQFQGICKSNKTCSVSHCDFSAGTGIFVNKDGSLTMYSVSKNEETSPSGSEIVRFREFNEKTAKRPLGSRQ